MKREKNLRVKLFGGTMKVLGKKFVKKFGLGILVLTIIYQFIKIAKYEEIIEQNDSELRYVLSYLIYSIESYEDGVHSKVVDMASLATSTGQAHSTYRSTSYYDQNRLFFDGLYMLNNNLTNRTNVEEMLEENDLKILIPSLEKLKDNPLDKEATEEFFYMVRKHTVIGSPLP